MVARAGASLPEKVAKRGVGVIVALGLERRSLDPVTRIGNAVTVLQSGPGPERAAAAARGVVRSGATALMSWGIAGGLVERAQPGTVVIPDAVIDVDGSELEVDPRLRLELIEALRVAPDLLAGRIVSVERILATPAAKTCSASVSGAVAADMESGAIARVAAEAGLPFVVVRVVADGPSDFLPRHAESFVTPAGSPRLMPLWPTLLSLRELRRLAVLARRSRIAERRLANLARRLAESSFLAGDLTRPGSESRA